MAEYKRIGKGGREVWIQATYNPILDLSGKPFKVVKFATDVTRQVQDRTKRESAQRQIDTDIGELDGAILTATEQATAAVSASEWRPDLLNSRMRPSSSSICEGANVRDIVGHYRDIEYTARSEG